MNIIIHTLIIQTLKNLLIMARRRSRRGRRGRRRIKRYRVSRGGIRL